MMKICTLLVSSIVTLCLATGNLVGDEAPLKPWMKNPWYWSYHAEPVLLLGGSDDDNLFQWPEDQLIPQLDRIAGAGGNVIRNTMSDRKDKGFELYPFAQRDDGRYDLTQWNDEYWQRFERLLKETARRKIFIQIEIWDRFDYSDSGDSNRWQIHPYNPKNNVNYNYRDSGFAKRYPDHPGANRQPFFFTTPAQQNNEIVLPFQQAFVRKLLDTSLPYDHVLYCMDNETNGEEEWSRYWARFVKEYAATQQKEIYVTEMWDDWNLAAARHKRTFDHPELYGFVDVSQNNHNGGQNHWDNFLHVRQYLASQPRPMNTTKTYGATDNKFGHSDQDGVERFWRHLLAGAASIRFHRPDSGLGINDKAVACIRAARKLEERMPLWKLKPANELLSAREPNEAYLATDGTHHWAVYFPAGGEVSIDLSNAAGELDVEWININTGEFGSAHKLSPGNDLVLTPPGNENWAAIVAK
ncbi:MAG: hypothetical protein CMJ46_00040 [Planctomyces sp.]|nr:hypothetical protein [Planctomyces sp.]